MRRFIPFVLLTLALAACGSGASTAQPTDAAMMEKPTVAAMMDKPTDAAMADTAMPAWAKLPLVNARTGETFTLADFKGKTIYVEAMATWCPNCRQQLSNVREARKSLGDKYAFIGLSVETTLKQEDLAKYADDAGFDWVFAVATPDMLQALAQDFGRTIGNPPSTPHFVIRPDGSVTELSTGIESPEKIVALVKGASGEK